MPSAAPGLTVVLPAYEEAARIGETIRRIRTELEPQVGRIEVIVVDDGSTDDTGGVARAAGADRVIVHTRNQGKGAAVRTGIADSSGTVTVFTDADLAYSPDQVLAVYRAVGGADRLVIGSRTHPDSEALVEASRLRDLGSRAVNLLTRGVLRGGYQDTQSGLKGFRTSTGQSLLSDARIDGMGFDIELLHRAERAGVEIVEHPVRVTNSERSSVRVVRDGLRLVADLVVILLDDHRRAR